MISNVIIDTARLYWRLHGNSVAADHRSAATELPWNLQYNLITQVLFIISTVCL
jgi:hypothetical protein